MTAKNRFVGVWSLVSVEVETDGAVRQPFGAHPIGRLTYDDAGRMSAQLMRPGRKCSVSDPGAVANASCDELREIADGYLGYYGTYTLDEDHERVIHHVEACTFPAWVGTEQLRSYAFVGNDLVLRAGSSKLVWQRCL